MIKNWWEKAVFYEVYVDKFADNFNNFEKRLDYLKFLGIDCIHLLPFFPSPMVDDGYDISDYRNVRPELGGLDDFASFAEKVHGMGMRLMVDIVLNHVSIEHPWFIDAKRTRRNPKRNFFLWSKTGKEYAGSERHFSTAKPNNWTYYPATGDYYFSTFYPSQADLNWDNPKVFKEMTGIIDFWIKMGADAFRLDAASYLFKREGTNSKSLPETHAMLKKIRAHINKNPRGKQIALLAEVHDKPKKNREYFGNGDECQLVYNFPLTEQIFLSLKNGNPSLAIKTAEDAWRGIPEGCAWANFLRNHDELSLATLDKTKRQELISHFTPKNDGHVFGRGMVSRLANMLGGDRERIINAFKILFSLRGSLIIYSGDEIGAENKLLLFGEKDARKVVRGVFDWETAATQMNDPDSLLVGISNMARRFAEQRDA